MSDVRTRPVSRAEFRRDLLHLIARDLAPRRRRPTAPEHVEGDTPLFESGLIDSMSILELIAFVEAATGRTIPARQIRIGQFATVDRICESFWPEDEVAHAME